MRLFSIFASLYGLILGAVATSNNLTDHVTWDRYSLSINGNRTYIYSAEFHYQRLPVPDLWPDVFQKFKANGFNTISVYFFWSYHSAAEGMYDFETPGKDVQRLFDYAREAGLWVIARAGPYCNAETNGGGLALWGSDGSLGKIRTGDETYHQAWLPWITRIGRIIAANQITEGGPVILNQIENEYQQPGSPHNPDATQVTHMKQIEAAFRAAGVVVPFTHNEKGMRSQSWSRDYQDVGGAVDVYGLDSYPGGLSCTNPDTGFNVVRTYHQWFQNYSFTQPEYLPEFEGGWFSNWGSDTFYDECKTEHDPAFADVYYKNNIGQRVTLHNIYMAYGGTNWGQSAAPQVYTSYDYSAPLRETRQQGDKLFQTKLIGLFTRVSSDLLKTDMVGNGTGYRVSSQAAYSWVLKNPDTGTGFHVVQQNKTPSRENISFSVDLDTSAGPVKIPKVELGGRQSKILVSDYAFGGHALLYCSADIAVYGVFGDVVDVLVLYLKEGQKGHFAFKDEGNEPLTYKVYGASAFSTDTATAKGKAKNAFAYTQAAGTTAVQFSNGVLVYLLDRPTAWRFWAPATTSNPAVRPNEQIFVSGPYLVRSASVKGNELRIDGDSDVATSLEAYTGTPINTIVWNGQSVVAIKTDYGSYRINITGADAREISLPKLTNWKSADSLPEAQPDYDDSKWTVCNKTTTLSPSAPETLPVLFSSDYGYYSGAKVYRGYFDGNNATTSSVYISASGGLGFGWNAWLNGRLVGGHPGNGSLTSTSATLALPRGALKSTNNLLTVVVDYHGHDQASTAKGVLNPRGILGAYLLPTGSKNRTGFKLWKIQGNAGGSSNIDAVRGPMNEGGLYAERLGWHLPGFDTANWNESGPLQGLAGPGIRFYVTNFQLNLDDDLDVPLGVELSAPAGTVARVMFWVNGYQYGKYVPHIGPQTVFPIPPGIINNRGNNTLAVSLWAQTGAGAKLDDVKLVSYGQYQTSLKLAQDWSRLQPGWADRSSYA
ncbi:Gti1/Pac2 family-domain-containing protein [Apiospora arundinis]|uniref:Beta-galactosidase n=1 Tax=Apiospora arundinis TaxID=335852 RepID=A0ABR2J621_9PEZI